MPLWYIYHIFTFILILKRFSHYKTLFRAFSLSFSCLRTNVYPLFLRNTLPVHNKTVIGFGYRFVL